MNRFALLGAATLAVVIGLGGFALLSRRPGPDIGTGPSPIPTTIPTAPPSAPTSASAPPSVSPPASAPAASAAAASTTPDQTLIDGSGFAVPFRMTLAFKLDRAVEVESDQVAAIIASAGVSALLLDRVAIDPCHSSALTPKPLTTVRAFMDWLGTLPHTTASPVKPITIGGVKGLTRVTTVGTLSDCVDNGHLRTGILNRNGASDGVLVGAGDVDRWAALVVDGKLITFDIHPQGDDTLNGAALRALQTVQFLH